MDVRHRLIPVCRRPRALLFVPLLALALLGGCGGGAEEGSEIPSPTARRGRLTLPGIDHVPLARVSRSNAEMRFLWAATDHYSEANGSREHGRLIRRTSCRAYIVECDDPDATRSRPFTYLQNYTRTGAYVEIDYAEAGLAPRSRHAGAWFKRAIDNAGIRLASVSIRPEGYGLVGQYGDGLDFLVVHSAGNGRMDAFPVRPQNPLFRGIARAAAADKVVYVAGYGVDAGGDVVRHPHSSGCDAVSDACVWAPFVTPGVGAGTSFGTARVAAALASVLAVFPRTTHQNLARMLKASARRLSTLPNGLGVVDLTRLTTLDTGGDWRLVQDGGEFNRAVAPPHPNHVTLPGNAAISSSFAVSPQGERITLGTVVEGTFGRTAPVVPADFRAAPPVVVAGLGRGLSLRLSRPGCDLHAGGLYEHEPSRLFAAAGVGIRDDFFGLGARHDYDETIAYEAGAGHRDLFFRVSRQWTEGRGKGLIESAQGTAIGVTARRSFAVSESTRVEAALALDKFAGGEARTVFGAVRMAESGWNRTVSVRLAHRPHPRALFTAGAEVFSPQEGDATVAAGVGLTVGVLPDAPHGGFPGEN